MSSVQRARGAAVLRRGLRLAAAGTFLLALLALLPPAGAAPRALLAAPAATALARLEPADAFVALGQTTVVNMFIQDVTNMYGADIRLQFDPARVQVVDVDLYSPGVQIQPLYGFLSPDFVIKRGACNTVEPDNPDCAEAGFIWYAVTQINPSAPVTGSGKIAAVTFRGLSAGAAPITMAYAKAADRNGNTIPLDRLDGGITVAPGSSLTPTPSPTPSLTPSATPTVTPSVTLTATGTPTPETGTVEGWVFLDADRDGGRDAGEPGLAGATVRVSGADSGQSVSVTTSPEGRYRVEGLLLDTDYWIKQFPLAGYDFTTPALVSVRFPSADARRRAEASFGNAPRGGSRLRLPILWR